MQHTEPLIQVLQEQIRATADLVHFGTAVIGVISTIVVGVIAWQGRQIKQQTQAVMEATQALHLVHRKTIPEMVASHDAAMEAERKACHEEHIEQAQTASKHHLEVLQAIRDLQRGTAAS